MILLPLELQLLVVENVEAVDIARLEQVCKSLRDLIQDSAAVIWRNVLYDHCIRNSLFWPSFGHLETHEQFKEAATATVRFSKAYRTAVASGQPIKRTAQTLELVDGIMGDDLREIHLIPGGRFVLFLQETGLAIWDMSEAPKVDLVFSIPIENILGLVYRNVIRNEIIQVILELSVQSYPTGFPIPDNDPPEVTSFEFIELFLNDDHIFDHKNYGRLTFLHPESTIVAAYSVTGNIIVILVENTTLAWDYSKNTYAIWSLGGRNSAANPLEMWSNMEFVMYVCDEGIYGVRLPDMKTLTKEYVVIDDSATAMNPTFFIPHQHCCPDPNYDPEPTFRILELDSLCPVDGNRPMLYDLRILEAPSTETAGEEVSDADQLRLHRYMFSFNASDPSKSRIDTKQSFLCGIADDSIMWQDLYSNFYTPCDGKTAAIWTDPWGSSFISISNDGADGSEVGLPLVPFTHVADGLDHRTLGTYLCPGSCKAIALWIDDEDDSNPNGGKQWLELYHFI